MPLNTLCYNMLSLSFKKLPAMAAVSAKRALSEWTRHCENIHAYAFQACHPRIDECYTDAHGSWWDRNPFGFLASSQYSYGFEITLWKILGRFATRRSETSRATLVLIDFKSDHATSLMQLIVPNLRDSSFPQYNLIGCRNYKYIDILFKSDQFYSQAVFILPLTIDWLYGVDLTAPVESTQKESWLVLLS